MITSPFVADVVKYRDRGFTFREVAILTKHSPGACRMAYYRATLVDAGPDEPGDGDDERFRPHRDFELAPLPDEYPLETLSGVWWHEPVKPPPSAGRFGEGDQCSRCQFREECAASVARGDYAFCERALKWEIVQSKGDK